MNIQPLGGSQADAGPKMVKKLSIIKLVVGLVVIILLVTTITFVFRKGNSSFDISPSSGPEGPEITLTYPKAPATLPGPFTVSFHDGGEHGWQAVMKGAGSYVTYDTTKGLTYKATAAANGSDGKSYKATVPDGICGLIIQSAQAPAAAPKVLDVSLNGPDGKPLPGTNPAKFALICDKYTLKASIKAVPVKVLPDGVSASTVTANFSVTGPAQFINGKKIAKGSQPIILTTPLGLMMVNFHTNLGTLAPSPSNVKTDLNGDAVVTITSADAGIAKVQAVASGVGDAIANVNFEPKITGVKEDFVQPNSPTNYQIFTIPANGKDLTFDWALIPPPGLPCGNLTGPASGMGLNKNGFFHGPTGTFPDGCPNAYEMATQVRVTVTDKDGQSDTKIFSARAFEGQGAVGLK